MHVDVTDLIAFYTTPLGQVVRRLLTHRIRARWRNVASSTIVGLGFASPYLGSYRTEAACVAAFMPSAQGAHVWPSAGPKLAALVDEERLPLADNSVDRLLAVHCLEAADRTKPLLREIWRVLAPEGRLLIIVPNRRSVWAQLDTTPFGHGRPFSRGQIERLLIDAMFSPLDWGSALHLPPVSRPFVLRSATAWERVGARVSPAFAGVFIVEASKEMVMPVGKAGRARAGKLVTVEGVRFPVHPSSHG